MGFVVQRQRVWYHPAPAARISLLDLIGRGRGVAPDALALYNETHAAD